MALLDQAALAANADFRSRVRAAAMVAALDVQGETPLNHGEVDEKRQGFAQQVLADGCLAKLDAFVWAVVVNPAITGASLDGDIQFTVNSVWSDLSGITGVEAAALII